VIYLIIYWNEEGRFRTHRGYYTSLADAQKELKRLEASYQEEVTEGGFAKLWSQGSYGKLSIVDRYGRMFSYRIQSEDPVNDLLDKEIGAGRDADKIRDTLQG
jgi:hypothetical protein